MRALSFTLALLSLSLLAPACRHRTATPGTTTPECEAPATPQPPLDTRIETWREVGVEPSTLFELPGSSDPFLWERRAASMLPKAQIPHRLHRPVD